MLDKRGHYSLLFYSNVYFGVELLAARHFQATDRQFDVKHACIAFPILFGSLNSFYQFYSIYLLLLSLHLPPPYPEFYSFRWATLILRAAQLIPPPVVLSLIQACFSFYGGLLLAGWAFLSWRRHDHETTGTAVVQTFYILCLT